MSAPATTKQPSRKTKKSWRKNIDLADVTAGIESARDESIITGGRGLLADAPVEILFQTDTTGDIGVQRKVHKELGKLMVDEIIAQRSAVPGVSTRKRLSDGTDNARKKQKTGVSRQEYERLKKIANAPQSIALTQAATSDALFDPWDTPQPVCKPEFSYIDPAQAIREPRTLRQAPISLTVSGRPVPNVRRPAAVKSYQPVAQEWLDALESEGTKAVEAEKARLAEAEKDAERLARVHASAEEVEKDRINDMVSEYEESEWEGIQSDMEEGALKKKRPQRKTPVERNRVIRRKEAERLARHEARTKERDQQAGKILAIKKEIEAKETAKVTAIQKFKAANPGSVVSEDDDSEEEQLRKRRFGQKAIPEPRLELVLPDELEDSLRRLKPEGNILDERFRNLIVQGRIEAKPRPIGQQKQRKVKVTEKWGYKDWKLSDMA